MPKLRIKEGELTYEIKGRKGKGDDMVLTLLDPHTGRKFTVPNAKLVIKTAGYKVIK